MSVLPLALVACSFLLVAAGGCVDGVDLDATNFCLQPALVETTEDLQAHPEWFVAPGETEATTAHIHVIDDFFTEETLERVLELSEASSYVKYWPKGDEDPWQWNSSALYVRTGELVAEPHEGGRFAPDWLRREFEQVIGEEIDEASWLKWDEEKRPVAGDGWNGAFHRFRSLWIGGAVHHHWKTYDVAPRGWSGLLFLSADEEQTCTTFWRERNTSLVIGRFGADFATCPLERFELAHVVKAKRNRLLLFREAVFHRAELGADDPLRLTLTFFFLSNLPGQRQEL